MKYIILFLLFATTAYSVNPGDTGTEEWRDVPYQQMPTGFNEPDAFHTDKEFTDSAYYWQFKYNCIKCVHNGGFSECQGGGGCSYRMLQQEDDPYMYVRLWNGNTDGSTIYWRGNTNDDFQKIGSAGFPRDVTFTAKLIFDKKDPIVDKIRNSPIHEFKDTQTYCSPFRLWTGTKILWAEFHLGGEPFRAVYTESSTQSAIFPQYVNAPANTIVEYEQNPTHGNSYLTFITKEVDAGDDTLVISFYHVLTCTDLVQGNWIALNTFFAHEDSMITYVLPEFDDEQRFFKISSLLPDEITDYDEFTDGEIIEFDVNVSNPYLTCIPKPTGLSSMYELQSCTNLVEGSWAVDDTKIGYRNQELLFRLDTTEKTKFYRIHML